MDDDLDTLTPGKYYYIYSKLTQTVSHEELLEIVTTETNTDLDKTFKFTELEITNPSHTDDYFIAHDLNVLNEELKQYLIYNVKKGITFLEKRLTEEKRKLDVVKQGIFTNYVKYDTK